MVLHGQSQYLASLALLITGLFAYAAESLAEKAPLKLSLSGTNCPELSEYQVEEQKILLRLAQPIQLGSDRSIERMFCQLSIELADSVQGTYSYQIKSLRLSGRDHLREGEQLRLDVQGYRQGDKDTWQDSREWLGSPGEAEDWSFQSEASQPFKLDCQTFRANQLKVSLLRRQHQAAPPGRSEAFTLSPEWHIQISRETCAK